jgi:hypothetical protein
MAFLHACVAQCPDELPWRVVCSMAPMRMTRHASSTEADWIAVSGSRPCPVCGGADIGCRVHLDEPFACCAHTPSDWPLTSGEWLHRTTDPEAA